MDITTTTIRPAGLRYFPDFLSTREETALVAELQRLDWDGIGRFKRRGREVRRREIYFDYVRGNRSIAPGAPLPGFLEAVRDRCAERLEVQPERLQQVIVTFYRPGAGIDWHTDSDAFEETFPWLRIASWCFRPRKQEPVCPIVLRRRSLFVLRGRARYEYQDHIPPVRAERYSITLRTLKEFVSTGFPQGTQCEGAGPRDGSA